ncbi:MAG: CvpA family protein [Anaerolineales bacterium]|nr:CvpA family protein [Anaerolineales bacterium]MCX7607850.1 CvpA family protein [Anaerolineales bacterium]MDW8227860.1 CvpA family protein [Anaerolineales bacterium]
MMNLTVVFWMYVILFAIIGGVRGWAKELLVAFSVILALTLSTLLDRYVSFVHTLLQSNPEINFWIHAGILLFLVFFGYQTPSLQRFAPKATREKLQDVLLGAVLGGVNGYLIAGSIWYFLHRSAYPFPKVVLPPSQEIAERVAAMMKFMPPELFGEPGIYFAVVIAFIFVLVVYL